VVSLGEVVQQLNSSTMLNGEQYIVLNAQEFRPSLCRKQRLL
jgi:hypothetical protein